MAGLAWNDGLSIGVAEVDAQHKRLIGLVNEVAEAVRAGAGRDIAGAALRNLCDYAVEHFASEEALMDPETYPEYDMHLGQHMDGTTKALDFLQAFSLGEEVDMEQFVAFLSDWVVHHVMEVDQTLGRHLRSRGVV
jgi:hemerythrin-like metal-binding protein